jgi:exopolysaccharide production protein ExoQ
MIVEPSTHRPDDSRVIPPLWIIAGQLGVVLALVGGFGAHHQISPRIFVFLVFVAVAGLVVTAPTRSIERVLVGVPVVLYVGWWSLSYLWTTSFGGFLRDSQVVLPTVLALVVIASLLPVGRFTQALVLGCQVIIAWTILFTLLNPELAMFHDDGTPGWRGGFIHKNSMAPFMLFALVTFAMFEQNRVRRWIGIALALFFVVVAQSTTTMVVGLSMLGLAWLLAKVREAPPHLRNTMFTTGMVGGLGVAALALYYLPQLVGAFGKDPTLTRRTEVWEGVLRVLGDRPWVGYGIGGVWIDQAAEHTREIHRGLDFNVFHAHNGLLEVALQLGAVGALLYVLMVTGFTRHAMRAMHADPVLATYLILYIGLIVLISITEVATFGIWLVLLCALYTVALRSSISGGRSDQASLVGPHTSDERDADVESEQ